MECVFPLAGAACTFWLATTPCGLLSAYIDVKPLSLFSLLVIGASAAQAQQVFVAPSPQTIIAGTELSHGSDATQLLTIRNESTIPIIVGGVTLMGCENIRQFCGGEHLHVLVPPGQQRTIFRVTPASMDRASNFHWRFVYHADSSDVKAMEILRANTPGAEQPHMTTEPPRPAMPPADPSPQRIEQPVSRAPIMAEERAGGVSIARTPNDTTPDVRMKFKVYYGSVLGSTMMPGAPIQLTGPCVNPAEATAYEKDGKITRTPWRPPVLSPAFGRLRVPIALKDSTLTSNDVLMRFAIDTTGEALPGSVSVLESPHGIISVNACKAAIAARATPARDKAGKLVRAWVQMPLRVGIQGT